MRIWIIVLMIVLMGSAVPDLLLQMGVNRMKPGQYPLSLEENALLVPQAGTKAQSTQVQLYTEDGTLISMDMETYLLGAVLAEMPASFEPEALKAQSVAARTYALKTMQTGSKHTAGSICANASCCQAYVDPMEYIQTGGLVASVDKVREAVEATAGLVLMYENQLIEALYFSCSGGRTEDAVAVWGIEYPYLQSVSSLGEEDARWYTDRKVFSLEEFADRLGLALEGDPEKWFGAVTYTQGGGIAYMSIGGRMYRGTELRMYLELRSTCFEIEIQENRIVITTKGYGHRVGMSQYGAEAMAINGSDFREILSHYYPGTDLTLWEP